MGVKNIKGAEPLVISLNCAQDWIRTSTPVKAPPPQDGVSTNFTTWAIRAQK